MAKFTFKSLFLFLVTSLISWIGTCAVNPASCLVRGQHLVTECNALDGWLIFMRECSTYIR